jgi:hypothetical protein
MLAAIARTFANYKRLPFSDRRGILNATVKKIVVKSASKNVGAKNAPEPPTSGATAKSGANILEVVVSGGILGEVGISANGSPSSRTSPAICAASYICLRLPQAFAIASSYVDRRAKNGRHPAFIAAQFKKAAA